MPSFKLHPRLDQDCYWVGEFALCRLLMMNDSQFPWFILVPSRADITEIYQLEEADRQTLLAESCVLAEKLQQIYQPKKLNIATIGNLVPQLHVHHVVRYETDKVWPAPIWGKLPAQAYSPEQADSRIAQLRYALGTHLIPH